MARGRLDLEPVKYSLMCGALISSVTLLVVLPGTWELPWLVADYLALTRGGVHVEVPLEGREARTGRSSYKGKSTSYSVPVLVFRPPGGAQVRQGVTREAAERAVATGKVPIVYVPGQPQRFRLEGHEADGIRDDLGLIGLIGLAPLWFGLFIAAWHLVGVFKKHA